jgi:hypothetical protein
MAAKLIKKVTVTETYEEDAAPKKARAEDPRDEELDEALEDLGDVEDDDDDGPPRRRRRK